MSLAGLTIGGRALGSEPVSADPTGVELFLDGVDCMAYVATDGGLRIERALNESGTADITFWMPPFVPTEGQVVKLRVNGLWRFGGTIDRVSQKLDGTARYYDCTCVDWMQVLDRILIDKTYTNQPLTSILRDLLATELAADGISEGVFEAGPNFPLVKAEQIRASEMLRDLAEGAGHSFWLDPLKGLYMRKTGFDGAPFTLDGTIFRASPASTVSRESYRNVQVVKVTGTTQEGTAATVVVERSNSVEIATRQAKEGGTGRYEVFDSLTHPSSNDSVELQRLGISYGVIQLARSGQGRRVVSGSTYQFGFEPGQLATVSLSDYGLSGSWLITRVRDEYIQGNEWRYELEARQTSPHELAWDAWLQMAGVGRAVVQLPIGIFSNLVEFTANGSWTVPGSGDVEIELDGFGTGGGGGGYDGVGPSGTGLNGGSGGHGGKAVTFLTVPAGTDIDLVVPAAGTGGLGDTAHTVNFTTPTTTTWAVPGTGSVRVRMTVKGAGGGSGAKTINFPGECSKVGGNGGRAISTRVYAAGTVLDVVVGAGGAGGVGGDGSTGGFSRVSLSGSTVAQGDAGGGGSRVLFPTNNGPVGAPGGGTGDSVAPGSGASGGAPQCAITNGNAGANGSITFEYADADDGTAGGTVTASIGGVLKMSASGGGAGGSVANDGAAGAPGGGTGDQVFTGEGSAGGAGGIAGSVNGQAGTAGKVQIRY